MNPAATAEFRENRAKFTLAELQHYEGQWVAFSADGKRIVDCGEDLVALYNRIREAKEIVAFDHIYSDPDEIHIGGEGFF